MKSKRKYKSKATRDLKRLLASFGIKAANDAGAITLEDIEDLADAIKAGYGQPSQMYMSPTQVESFDAAFKSIAFDIAGITKKKQP